MDNINFELSLEQLWPLLIAYAPKLLLALATLLIGLWLIKRFVGWMDGRLATRTDPSLHRFALTLASIGLKILLLISVASLIGIPTTSFIAVLGAAGLAIGLALQGSLSNFAGGVLILIFKPFRVGDVIEAAGYSGVVREIQIFHTILTTFDNRRVVIPNAQLSNNSLVNINIEPTRRVDMKFSISHGDDIVKAKNILASLLQADSRVLQDPAPTVALSELGESSLNFVVRAWVKTPDYWPVFFNMQEQVKQRFDAENITLPHPQRTIRLHQVA